MGQPCLSTSYTSYRRNLALHVLLRIGGHQLSQITPMMLNRLYSELVSEGNRTKAGGLGPKTVRYIHTIIHKVLADASDAGVVARNPAERAKPPRPEATLANQLMVWKPSELHRFLRLAQGHPMEMAWRLAAMTGMRRGEVLGLHWDDVDFEEDRISVRQTVISVGYEIVRSTPKNHQARVIDLDASRADRRCPAYGPDPCWSSATVSIVNRDCAW